MLAIRLHHPALLRGKRLRLVLGVDRPDELGRVREGRVVRIDLDHREDRRKRDLEGKEVAELLLDEVADHALRLGAEDVERVRVDLGVGRALQGEQPDLGAVAVRDDELVITCHAGESLRGVRTFARWLSAVIGSPRLRSALPAERHHDLHAASPLALVNRPGWPPSRP